MSTVRKVDPAEAAGWDLDLAPFVLETMLARNAGTERTGLTRIDRSGADGGEHAWRARVYHGSNESHRQFADALYGGTEGALRAAVTWRDTMRQQIGQRPPRPGRTWRLVKVDDPAHKLIGYYAYADHRRYFSISKYGGWAGAQATAEDWLHQRRLGAS
ncbi:MAG: hypothetical protein ABIV47_23025 [Roseiflexaceae bacterium]